MKGWKIYICLFLLSSGSCERARNAHRTIVLQPLGKFSIQEAREFLPWLPGSIVAEAIPIPDHCLNMQKYRYRADKLLVFLSTLYGKDTLVVGLTHKDISTSKGIYPDWGIMGLANRPGRVCVISSYRPARNGLRNQLYKVVLHEIGHTTGLPHCKVKSCLMRDAEGGIPLKEEKEFCTGCMDHIRKSNWRYSPFK